MILFGSAKGSVEKFKEMHYSVLGGKASKPYVVNNDYFH